MNADKIKLAAWLEKHEPEMIDMLSKLVSTPSDNPAGDCLPISEVVAEQLRLEGSSLSFDLVDEEDARAVGMIRVQNVIASTVLGFGEGPNNCSQFAWGCSTAGRWLDLRSIWRGYCGWQVIWSRCCCIQVGYCFIYLRSHGFARKWDCCIWQAGFGTYI